VEREGWKRGNTWEEVVPRGEILMREDSKRAS